MNTEKSPGDFRQLAVREVYFKPLFMAAFCVGGAIVPGLVLRAWKPGVDPVLLWIFGLLCAVCYLVAFINGKVDMLKRNLDQEARYRDSKRLWLE